MFVVGRWGNLLSHLVAAHTYVNNSAETLGLEFSSVFLSVLGVSTCLKELQ